MIPTIAFGIGIISLIIMLFRPYEGILFSLATKPIVDAAWEIKPFGISILMLQGFGFLIFASIFIYRLQKRSNLSKSWWKIGLLYLTAHTGLILFGWISNTGINQINFLSKALYLPIAFLMIPLISQNVKLLKPVLMALLIAGAFPIVITIMQTIGIDLGFTVSHSKGLARMNGFYHDIVTTRIYIFQTLIALFLFWNLYKPKFHLRLLLFLFLGMAFYALYFTYSKAAIGIAGIWLVTYLLLTRQFLPALALGLVALVVYNYLGTSILEETEVLFEREIGFAQGETEQRLLFSGRGGLWSNYLYDFWNQPTFMQIIGSGMNSGGVHNEFLRILVVSGFLGLFAFIIFIFRVAVTLFQKFLSYGPHPIVIASILLFEMFLVDCIGVVPGLYPFYLIFTFGIMGLMFNKELMAEFQIREKLNLPAHIPLETILKYYS